MTIHIVCFILGILVGGLAVYFSPREKQIVTQTVDKIDLVETEVLDQAKRTVADVEKNFSDMNGEFKRSQALRSLTNIFPTKKVSDLALAIELAVRKS